MKTTRWTGAAVAAVALALGLSACSSGPADEGAPSAPAGSSDVASPADDAHNAADAEFAQMMIIHHEGAIEMAQLAVSEASTGEVRALGERIAASQGPEIDLMSGWLESWGEPLPEDAEMGDMGHGGMDMEGMDQEQVMAQLSGLTGPELDRRFLELMIDHHQGAIEMAETERADGENADAIALAGTIIDDQTAEITQMRNLLAGL